MSRYRKRNKERIYNFNDTKDLVKSFKRNGIPLSVLLLSEFWHIKDKNNYNLYKSGYSFNKELFPNPKEFTNCMHDLGVRVGLNIDPSEGVRKEEEKYLIDNYINMTHQEMGKVLNRTDGAIHLWKYLLKK